MRNLFYTLGNYGENVTELDYASTINSFLNIKIGITVLLSTWEQKNQYRL